MYNADGKDNVKLLLEIHLRDVSFYKRNIAEMFIALFGEIARVKVHRGMMFRVGRHIPAVLSAPASALQTVFSFEMFERIRMYPVFEQKQFIVLQHAPLLVPLILFLLHSSVFA